MSTPVGGSLPPPRPSQPPSVPPPGGHHSSPPPGQYPSSPPPGRHPASPPPRTDPPRWAWWVGGIAIPVVGIVVTVLVSGSPGNGGAPAPAAASGSSPQTKPSAPSSPDQAGAESPSSSATPSAAAEPSASADPSASASPDADLTSPAGYGQVVRTMWGLAPAPCTQHEQQLVDLDDGTSRVEPENNGAVADRGGAELLYWPDTCTGFGDYLLRGLPNARVGLLRTDMPKSFESCQAAAGTGFGALALSETTDREERGFVEGAAICSVTDQGAVTMAVIEHMDGGATDDLSVSGSLYAWPKSD